MKSFPNPKINIGLNILKRRDDGFHDIETVFIPLTKDFGYDGDLYDTLEITPRTDGQTTLKISWADSLPGTNVIHGTDGIYGKPTSCGTEGTPGMDERTPGMDKAANNDNFPENGWPKDKDLCIKAYNELAAHYPLTGADISLTKRIPTGAGLGGGSADAAFTLKMLNELFSLGLDDERLAIHASHLGSDVPFFIYNRPMFASGRGEILTPISCPILSGRKIGVVTPRIAVSTAEAYSGVKPAMPETGLRELISSLPLEQWKGRIANDFEESIFRKHPALGAIKASLYEVGAVYASMSGSGSALYGIF